MTELESAKMDRRFSLGRVGAVAVVLGLLLAIFSVVIVETGQVGVVMRTGAEAPSRVLATPGIYLRLPFAERIWLIDIRLQTTEQMTPQSFTSQDNQSLQLAAWAAWRVNDPELFNTSTASGKNSANERVLTLLAKTLTGIAQVQTAAALQQGLPAEDQAKWLSSLNTELKPLGMVAEQIGLRQVSLSESANEAIYKRMAASRQQAEQQLVQGLSADEQQLVALQTKQRDQVLGDAYKQSQQQRLAAETRLVAAYAKQYGQAAAFQDRLNTPQPASAAEAVPPGGANAPRSE
jgi:regulator of protease activity HflC (stomatin/prohibitin superfamily)